jgi:ribosomal subunit interface protein
MKVIVQGKQLRLSQGIKSYVDEHMVEPLRRFYDNEAAELRVEFGRGNGNRGEAKECHVTFHMPGGRTLQIEEETSDLYGGLDNAADRLLRNVKKELGRMRTPSRRHKEHPLSTVAAEGGVPAGLIEDLPAGRAFRRIEKAAARRTSRRKRSE